MKLKRIKAIQVLLKRTGADKKAKLFTLVTFYVNKYFFGEGKSRTNHSYYVSYPLSYQS